MKLHPRQSCTGAVALRKSQRSKAVQELLLCGRLRGPELYRSRGFVESSEEQSCAEPVALWKAQKIRAAQELWLCTGSGSVQAPALYRLWFGTGSGSVQALFLYSFRAFGL